MKRVSFCLSGTKARISSARLGCLFWRPGAPEAPLTMKLEKKFDKINIKANIDRVWKTQPDRAEIHSQRRKFKFQNCRCCAGGSAYETLRKISKFETKRCYFALVTKSNYVSRGNAFDIFENFPFALSFGKNQSFAESFRGGWGNLLVS